jgi:pimeloyl-ACP methyl ester carboxylesterase
MTDVLHRHAEVDGVRVFFRESVPDDPDAAVLLLLHGFPSGSHQFRGLIDALGSQFRVIAPDYPGFGRTEVPPGFQYSFDRLADITEGLVASLGLTRFVMYVFDYGAPVGFRLALRHPEWIAGLVAQNGNAYAEGLSDSFSGLIARRRDEPGAVEAVTSRLTPDGIRAMHLGGAARPELIDPDIWTLDLHFLAQPGHTDAVLALTFDYHSNVEQYPQWQAWLRKHTPPTLVIWGKNDPIFPESGAHAYLRDVPEAEVHIFDAGHFALEEKLPQVAPQVARFADRAARGFGRRSRISIGSADNDNQ